MRKVVCILFQCLLCAFAHGQERDVAIPNIEVFGSRPMKEIGLQCSKIDSASLHDNISLSMADVLTFSSSVFVKQSGRATLSTVAFRGTSPSHTVVTWNGMKINSPMLGMTDFSMIPSYFIDSAVLLHGTSSVTDTGGGLGGSVRLSTAQESVEGFRLQFVQGIGSFTTFDEYLRLSYGGKRWGGSTRVVFSYSPNDYHYINRDKKENIYDSAYNIIGQYYPEEYNRSGSYRDLHVLQDLFYRTRNNHRLGLSAWYVNSRRELPCLTTDYAAASSFENLQREDTFRSVFSWDYVRTAWKIDAKAGYTHTWMGYDYRTDCGNGVLEPMTRSRSDINTLFSRVGTEFSPSHDFLLSADITFNQHFVESSDRNIKNVDGIPVTVGYDRARSEISGSVSARWRPVKRIGITAVLREERFGTRWSPVIPALFLDGVLSERGEITLRSSISRNYRFPTLNDLYFQPGGNPDLKPEKGFSYDAGIGFSVGKESKYRLTGKASWFDSRISDWIIWLPTVKGYYSPRNLKKVHAFGIETSLNLNLKISGDWRMDAAFQYSWTPSVSCGEPLSESDESIGKQLPYVPEHSSSATARLSFRRWSLEYKWCFYSERFTMTSNTDSFTGRLPDYFMNDVALEKTFEPSWAKLSLKLAVRNLFNESYMSVLSHPMPGINFEVFIGITPKW